MYIFIMNIEISAFSVSCWVNYLPFFNYGKDEVVGSIPASGFDRTGVLDPCPFLFL